MNRHCRCALIVGPVREIQGRCHGCRVVSGGEGEGRIEVEVRMRAMDGRSGKDERRDEAKTELEVEEKKKKVGM